MPLSDLAAARVRVVAGGHLRPFDDVLQSIRDRPMAPLPAEEIDIEDAGSRVLAEDVSSQAPIPPYRSSAVDGYAFRASDGHCSPRRIVGRSAAGHPFAEGIPSAGSAIRILTGAAVPSWADTVAQQEDCDVRDGTVVTMRPLSAGANIREVGEDVTAGAAVLFAGDRLRPQDVAMAASVGRPRLIVYRRLRVAVLATGDELRAAGRVLPPGCIHDSNRYFCAAVLERLGFEVTDFGIVPDDPGRIRDGLIQAARSHDLVLTSGGVADGDEDHVVSAVASLGSVASRSIAMKPGKGAPLGDIGGVPFMGLPGNPAAAMVALVMVARPLALRLAGANRIEPHRFRVAAGQVFARCPDRRHFLRGHLEQDNSGVLIVRKFRSDSSGMLSSLTWSDGLIDLRPGNSPIPEGDPVDFIPYSEFLA
jgi:molybdopterin molybdotransferase